METALLAPGHGRSETQLASGRRHLTTVVGVVPSQIQLADRCCCLTIRNEPSTGEWLFHSPV